MSSRLNLVDDYLNSRLILVIDGDSEQHQPWNIFLTPEAALKLSQRMKLIALRMQESKSLKVFDLDNLRSTMNK